MSKRHIRAAAAFLRGFLVIYMIGAFAALDLDPAAWEPSTRLLVGSFGAMAGFLSFMMHIDHA